MLADTLGAMHQDLPKHKGRSGCPSKIKMECNAYHSRIQRKHAATDSKMVAVDWA